MQNLPAFPSFDCETDKVNAGTRWRKWLGRFENMLIGMNITNDKRQRALLLHYAGERVYDIYEAEKAESEDTYKATKEVLIKYFEPKRNVQMDIYTFRNCKQKDEQSLDEFVTELRQLAKTCAFVNTDGEILSQVIQHCKSTRFRKRALREPDKSLAEILEIGRSLELIDQQAAKMERETVNKIGTDRSNKRSTATGPFKTATSNTQSQHADTHAPSSRNQSKMCINCGGEYPHQHDCPARGKICNYCKKPNHFKNMCFKLKKRNEFVRNLEKQDKSNSAKCEESDSESSGDEYLYGLNEQNEQQNEEHFVSVVGKQTPKVTIKVNNIDCELMIDTGATVNILDENTYQQLGKPKLSKHGIKHLHPYGGGPPLEIKGRCELVVESSKKMQCHSFYVVSGSYGALLGYSTAVELNLISIVNRVSDPSVKYPNLKKGIGKLKDITVKLHIDESVKPVAQRHRRTPFHLREKVEKEVEKLLEQDIIEKVEGVPTPWVSPIVTPPKKDSESIRLCVDMREPNKAIIRERHLTPTVEELISDLNGSKVFSKLDLRAGYHQLVLDPDSRYITTFSTHIGLYRYKRLSFGISSASEVFQKTIQDVIKDIPGTKNIADDIIIFGTTQQEHDVALEKTFQRLSERGLTINEKKCEYNKEQIEFFGLVFSSRGVSPDPKKVEAVQKIEAPKNASEVRSFLGMLNYSSRFIPNYATVSEPLRRLTRQDTQWTWSKEQEEAFESLKGKLTDSPVMAYFDPSQSINIITDASPVGVGAILEQNEKVVAYASRALTPTEQRYSQTEREALGVVWACEHFDMYVRGAKHFTVTTDHQPLERIWKKPKPPLRIERWGLRLQPYKLSLQYRPGNKNPSDYMSRHPTATYSESMVTPREQKMGEHYVNFITDTSAYCHDSRRNQDSLKL